mmetsp:Transcript_25268/g.84333  ORF Transcript_25268/g.84333 Transcript_25268/m.84333 type:complete len:470 (-) Transcript_25268:62-1471(-)
MGDSTLADGGAEGSGKASAMGDSTLADGGAEGSGKAAADRTAARAARRASASAASSPLPLDIFDDEDHAGGANSSQALVVVRKEGLVKACYEGKVLEVRHLIKEKADPNAFEAHLNGATRLTPLMAAAAGSKVDIVAELLVSGADPELQSPLGVVAGDLLENDQAGKRIKKLLAVFREEIESVVASQALAASPAASPPAAPASPGSPGSPEASPSSMSAAAKGAVANAAAVLARRDAIARVQQLGLALVEKALIGYASLASEAITADGDIEFAGLQGEEARQARKQRHEEKEQARMKAVAERAAKRRSGEGEEARLQRVAEKAAARRKRDPEDEERDRLRKIADKAAARREKTAEAERKTEQKEEAKLKRLAEKASDRASKREMRLAVVEQTQSEHKAEADLRPVKRKVVEADVFMCINCGGSTHGLKCGRCMQMGMCEMCSKCRMCGTVSGFATKVQKILKPGMIGGD